jgi:hypothetical protein
MLKGMSIELDVTGCETEQWRSPVNIVMNFDFILTVYNAVFNNLNFIHTHQLYCMHNNYRDL